MMLWYKAWIESRLRFGHAMAAMGAATSLGVLFHDPVRSFLASGTASLDTYTWYICRILYQGFGRTLFMIFAFLFGLGGLLRERELGTAAFTLALPVSRLRLVATRAVVGWIELAALAFLPSIVVVVVSPLAGQGYPLAQALQFSVLWTAGGSALYAVAFLASAMLAGEYTAFIVAWVIMFGHTVTTQFIRLRYPALNRYLFTVQEMMSGFRMPYFDPHAHMLIGPFPLIIVMALIAFATALAAAAVVWTQQRDF
jgi:ABC-2 type transport system permease protein